LQTQLYFNAKKRWGQVAAFRQQSHGQHFFFFVFACVLLDKRLVHIF